MSVQAHLFDAIRRQRPAIKAAVSGGPGTIQVIGDIGEVFGGVVPSDVAAQLAAVGPRDVVVQLSSPGGSVGEGMAIYDLLRAHAANGHKVTVVVVGSAESIAACIAMAGDRILFASASGELMIHQARTVATWANADTLEALAADLRHQNERMVNILAARSGRPPAEVSNMIADGDCRMSAAEAIRLGFANGIVGQESRPVATSAERERIDRFRASLSAAQPVRK